jgi:replicative DNA helicase
VRKLADRRRLADYATELERQACATPAEWSADDDELYAVAEYDLEQIVQGRVRERQPNYHWRTVRDEELWKLGQGEDQGIPTGYEVIDAIYGGFKDGEPAYIGARTSVGKTQLAVNFAINTARGIEVFNSANGTVERRQWPTAFFSIEMPLKGIALRPVGPLSKVDLFRARKYGLSDADKFNIKLGNQVLDNIPLEIIYRPIFRPRDLKAECRRLKREMGLKFFIVDYQGLMMPDGEARGEARWEKIHAIVQQIKDIAGELELAALFLSQLNRLTDGTQNPSASQLRDTGFSEETASDVMLLWQSADDVEHGEWQPLTLEIEKQRSGPHHVHVPLDFLPTTGQFRAGEHHKGCCPALKEETPKGQKRNGPCRSRKVSDLVEWLRNDVLQDGEEHLERDIAQAAQLRGFANATYRHTINQLKQNGELKFHDKGITEKEWWMRLVQN